MGLLNFFGPAGGVFSVRGQIFWVGGGWGGGGDGLKCHLNRGFFVSYEFVKKLLEF